jgi:hypothetical protein
MVGEAMVGQCQLDWRCQLDAKSVHGDGDGSHEAELGWSELTRYFTTDGACVSVKCSHVSWCDCKLDL